jgi:hypothetical protein
MARFAHGRPALVRAFAALLGCAGVAWGLLVFPSAWRHMPIERVASAIVAGDAFKPEVLAAQIAQAEATPAPLWCRPASLRSTATVRLALWEEAVASAAKQSVDVRIEALRDAIVRSLACSPAEPYLWLVLFTVDSSRTGFDPRHLAYLRLSYRLGPNEGWISMHRLRVAFSVFDRLTPDLQELATREFTTLVANGFHQEAAGVVIDASEPLRQALLARLATVQEGRRQEFAEVLYQSGYYDMPVPGIARPGARPWR